MSMSGSAQCDGAHLHFPFERWPTIIAAPVQRRRPVAFRIPSVRAWLAQELGFAGGWAGALWSAVGAGGAVFFVLAVYQPFGTREAQIEHKFVLLGGYGVITGLVVLLLHRLTERFLRRGTRWTRALLLAYCSGLLVLAGPVNYAFYCWAFGLSFSLAGLGYFYQLSAAIAVLPLLLLLWRGTRIPAERVEAAAQPAAVETPERPRTHVLTGENKDEALTVDSADLLLVKAADNYAEVLYLDGQETRTRLLRTSLSGLAQQLADTQVLRTHRSYLVNIGRVLQCTGNAQGFQLRVAGVDETVPVSRAYVAEVRAALKRL